MKIKRESPPQRCEICHKSDCYDKAREICKRCLTLTNKNKENFFPLQDVESCSLENLFWQNKNQRFTLAVAFAAFSLLFLSFYLLPSSTCVVPWDLSSDDFSYSHDLNTKKFWIGVISSGFFFSGEQLIVKMMVLLVGGGFLGFIAGLFAYICPFQHTGDTYSS